jgi:hypothetical protein
MEQVIELVSDVAKSAPGKFAAYREADPAELGDNGGGFFRTVIALGGQTPAELRLGRGFVYGQDAGSRRR